MPGMSVAVDQHDGAQTRSDQLLAVRRLWRGLERRETRGVAARRTRMAVSVYDLTRELEELVAALDRRLPHVQRAGETSIARDAAALRAKAVRRLAELTGTPLVPAGPRPDTKD
jgi:hypothetical protein